MDFDPAGLIRPHILNMPAYQPILPVEVVARQRGLPEDQIIKLDGNENPYGPLPQVLQVLAHLSDAHLYPDPESRELRKALANYHRIPAEHLLVGAGADELIDLLMRLVLEPGESLIDCPPTFGMYEFDGHLNRAQVISVPRSADFSIQIGPIEREVQTRRPKLLFLAHPNNPDGSLLDPGVVERLLVLPLIVVLDEAYIEFAQPGSSYLSQVPQRSNLAVLRTFSKWAGLAGLRLGYGAFPLRLVDHLWKIKQPYNVSVAASRAACVSLQFAPQLDRIRQEIVLERERLYRALQAIPWLQPYPSQSNFILCRVIGRDAAWLKDELARAGILVRYFNKPGLRDHIRISIGRPEHTQALLKQLSTLE